MPRKGPEQRELPENLVEQERENLLKEAKHAFVKFKAMKQKLEVTLQSIFLGFRDEEQPFKLSEQLKEAQEYITTIKTAILAGHTLEEIQKRD